MSLTEGYDVYMLGIFGYMRDFMRKYGLEKSKSVKETGNQVRISL